MTAIGMVMAYRPGPTVLAMKECGKMIRHSVKENLFTLMAMFMKGNGSMTKQKEPALILMQMVPTTKVNGSMICNMDRVLNPGLMVLVTRASTMRERKKVRVD